ncbi:MAG: M43 family zinc metalloprotease [Bacteroidia bacterium]
MEKKPYKLILLGAFAFFLQTSVAQTGKQCGTTQAEQKLRIAHPELLDKEQAYNKELQQHIELKKQLKSQSSETVYRIPVVFHIIHTNGDENITDAQIYNQVDILNRDFAKQNLDTAEIVENTPFDTLAVDTKFEFRLARIDPDGNCTNGIDRIYSHKSNNASDASKLNPWPRHKYLNVWVVKSIGEDGAAGYAYFPTNVDASPNIDGIIILYDYIGSIGEGSENNSRALTHEIGHWLSLYHPWGGTNDPEVECGDDGVEDTPVTKGHLSCNLYTPYCEVGTFASPYGFDSVTPVSGTTDTTSVAASTGVSFGEFEAVGVSANSTDSMRFSFSDWDTGAPDSTTVYDSLTGSINTSKYYEVTVTPKFGSSMTLTGITFSVQRDSTGVRTYAVRSSANNYASNLAASISPANANLEIKGTNVFFINKDTTSNQNGSKITLSGAAYTNAITPITFRFYGWNAEDTAGTFSIDNVNFTGSAGTIENTQNYMDYSYCSVMFTKGQKARMRAAAELNISGRNNLWKAANLAATGADDAGQAMPPCVPKPDFFANRNNVCTGGTVTFTKNIMLGTPTNATWTFDGGTPATSTANSPTVTYNTPGEYAVKLKATNASGTDSVIKEYFIHVSQPWTQYSGLAVENFENPSSYYWNWWTNNYDNNPEGYWSHTNAAGYNSTSSMIMSGNGNYVDDVDDFITPPFDLDYVSGAQLTFRCAAASKALTSADLNDVLKVYTSNNCGQSWTLRSTIQGTTLNNNNYHPENFVPTTASQWALHTVNIPNSAATNNVRFKFEYTTGNASNNVFIDDINITGVLGMKDNAMDEANVSIYPNPANQSATISYHLNKQANVKLELVDLLGKKVMDISNSNQAEGDYTIQLSKAEHQITSGIYFVKLSIGTVTTTKKLIFTE